MHITTRGARLWVHEQGAGPALLLLGGLSDPAETWQAQIDAFSDRYRVIAPDNRGAGRSPIPSAGIAIAAMAEDAADVLRELEAEPAHVMGFSMGGAIAQELALAHPDLVRSLVLNGTYSHPDAYFRQMVLSWMTAARHASSERELLETFFLWIYTRRAHRDGTVAALIAEALESPLAQTLEGFYAQAQACIDWPGTAERLGAIAAPALVTVGGEDIACPPRLSRELVAGLPNAELVVLPGEAHQPFQEVPEEFNRIVAGFWRRVERGQDARAAA
jgi:pimeloyl-ACP methyl ester carboxylesterase